MAQIWQTLAEELDWETRKSVLFHFFCYKYFSNMLSHDGIDLINLTDADVQYYNRECDKTRGTRNPCQLAHSLNEIRAHNQKVDFIPDMSTHSYRKALIAHVACYNYTVNVRRRFFMINITAEEIEYLSRIPHPENDNADTRGCKTLLTWATDGGVGKAGAGVLEDFAEKDENHISCEVDKHVVGCVENGKAVKTTADGKTAVNGNADSIVDLFETAGVMNKREAANDDVQVNGQDMALF